MLQPHLAIMVLGAQSWKPLGWVAVVLVLIALLLALGVRL